jgi:hypothetical protein
MTRARLRGLSAAAVAVACGLVPASASATHGPAIHPGVQTHTAGAQCTSNFVFRDRSGTYLGQAAHCSGRGAATDTNGCEARSLPLGTAVDIEGARRNGRLVYSSWITMRRKGETDASTCQFNDFALVRIARRDVRAVDPTVPGFGGPTGVGASSAALGDTVYSYGNSSLRGGVTRLSPKQGVVVSSEGNGWSRTVYTLTPGIPGDSGSGFMDASGRAIGVLSTLQILPTAGSNGVGDLRKELQYMRANSSFSAVRLVRGRARFRPNLVGPSWAPSSYPAHIPSCSPPTSVASSTGPWRSWSRM